MFFLSTGFAGAQSFYSMNTGNYGGVRNNLLNPAFSVDTKLYLDVNVISGSGHLVNNYFYIPKEDFTVTDYFFSRDQIPTYGIYPDFPDGIPFLNRPGIKNPRQFAAISVLGPSFQLAYRHQAVTFYTALKGFAYSNMPGVYLEYLVKGNDYRNIYAENLALPRFRSGMLLWGETAIGYAGLLNPDSNDNWYLGGNLKLLTGYFGFWMRSEDINYSITDQSVLTLSEVDMSYGNTSDPDFLQPYGYGLGIDLGVSYIKRGRLRAQDYYTTLQDQSYGDYLYKVGISITDLGRIGFTRESKMFRMISRDTIYIEELNSLEGMPFDSVSKLLADHVYEIVTPEEQDDRFKMLLPARISAQFDYRFGRNLYIGTTLVSGIPFKSGNIRQPLVLTICPRYETGRLEFWMPFSYNQFTRLQVGLAVRAGFVTIGSERLIKSLFMRDFMEMDLFVGLRVPLKKRTVKE